MWQPSTGVCGEEDKAMLSSLLNISDSVPPAHTRWPTTSHFFLLRDLSEQKGASNTLFWLGAAPTAICCCSRTGRHWEHPSPMDRGGPETAGTTRPLRCPPPHRGHSISLSRSFPLEPVDIPGRHRAIFCPIHSQVQLLHQPLALLAQMKPGWQRASWG